MDFSFLNRIVTTALTLNPASTIVSLWPSSGTGASWVFAGTATRTKQAVLRGVAIGHRAHKALK